MNSCSWRLSACEGKGSTCTVQHFVEAVGIVFVCMQAYNVDGGGCVLMYMHACELCLILCLALSEMETACSVLSYLCVYSVICSMLCLSFVCYRLCLRLWVYSCLLVCLKRKLWVSSEMCILATWYLAVKSYCDQATSTAVVVLTRWLVSHDGSLWCFLSLGSYQF